MTSTWFITGTSSGFGRELTERLLERGDRVAATLRGPERLNDLATQYSDRLWVRELDVRKTEQMREVVDAAFAELGRIDVVVSNAGFGVFGTAEEHSDEQIDGIVATNLVGSIQLVRAVTPHLREQGGGRPRGGLAEGGGDRCLRRTLLDGDPFQQARLPRGRRSRRDRADGGPAALRDVPALRRGPPRPQRRGSPDGRGAFATRPGLRLRQRLVRAVRATWRDPTVTTRSPHRSEDRKRRRGDWKRIEIGSS